MEIREEQINYRKSSWIQYAVDRERFHRRIKNLNYVLTRSLDLGVRNVQIFFN